jgi:CBS domain-containing protein
MRAGEFCNRDVAFVYKSASVAEAAAVMREANVGSVVVVEELEGARRPVGMLTDRDIVIEFVTQGVAPADVEAGDAVGPELVTVNEDTALYETIELMLQRAVRRVPVVDADGALVGLFASDDALELLTEQLQHLAWLVSKQRRQESKRRG